MTPSHFELVALDPHSPDEGRITYRILMDTVDNVLRYDTTDKFHELRGDGTPGTPPPGSSVAEILLRPAVIFGGLRGERSRGLCYSGRPSQSWSIGGAKLPPRRGMVFAVYVSAKGEVFEWGREKEHESRQGYPVGFDLKGRFTEGILWPKTGNA